MTSQACASCAEGSQADGHCSRRIYLHRRLCRADCWNSSAVDVLQADVTRCGGISGFLQVGALCEAHHIDLSGHCAPALHRHVACSVPRLRHLEWFHDHVRIEQMLFEGAPTPQTAQLSQIWIGPATVLCSRKRMPSVSRGWERIMRRRAPSMI